MSRSHSQSPTLRERHREDEEDRASLASVGSRAGSVVDLMFERLDALQSNIQSQVGSMQSQVGSMQSQVGSIQSSAIASRFNAIASRCLSVELAISSRRSNDPLRKIGSFANTRIRCGAGFEP